MFDDSFSALDYKTDRAVRDRINIMYKNSIKVIVSQRISTIINADKIIVLENGSISGIGTNESLLKNCDAYRQLVAVQSVGGKR